MMRTLLRSIALVPALAACAGKPDNPRLEFATVGFVLHLLAAMKGTFQVVNYPDSSATYQSTGGHFAGTRIGG